MSSPLLATKFYIPQARVELVRRPRLQARLDMGLARKLTLVCAPAGYGKTCLVADWLSQVPARRVGWLSLDEGDNDPARFLTYLITAIQRAEPSAGERAIAILHSPQLGGAKTFPAETLLNILVNDLDMIAEPVILILEDYHFIQTETIHQYLNYLLDHLPTNVHIYLVSRAEPPLSLALLRARGQLIEIRTSDLRFSEQETGEFLNQVMRLGLDKRKIARLSARTEGWISGLLMAAVSMQGRQDVDAFIEEFTGSNRYIMDYLVEEVLQQQPEYIQQFLLFTCPLGRFCGELCDEIMAEAIDFLKQAGSGLKQLSSASILVALERANLFTISLDEQREWYRYHRLFADLLGKRLREAFPTLLPRIHHRASSWLEKNGYTYEAIDHCFASGDLESVANLVEQAAETALNRSETRLLMKWLEKIPEPLIQARPDLHIFRAMALLISSQKYAEVETMLDKIDTGTPGGIMEGKVESLKALLSMLKGDFQQSIHLSRVALDSLSEDQLLFKCLAADNLGMCYVLSGDNPSAIQAFEETVSLARRSGNIMLEAGALANLAGLQYVKGHLRDAWVNYNNILALATDSNGQRLPVAGKALTGLGEVAREWNDLETAASYLDEAVKLLSYFVEIGAIICYLSLSRVRQAQGDWEKAWELLSIAQRMAQESKMTSLDDRLVAVSRALFSIRLGNYEQVISWARERNLNDDVLAEIRGKAGLLGYEILEPEYLTLVRLLIAQEKPDKALHILGSLQSIDEQQERGRRLLEVLCLQAIAWQAKGVPDKALSVLQRALREARAEGYVRTFIDEGEPMLRLLEMAIHRGIEVRYATSLVAALHAGEYPSSETASLKIAQTSKALLRSGRSDTDPSEPLVEPLSARELEVLQLIALGLSNGEIGAQLVISLSTVKGHTANIFGKLGVNNRTQAVSRARELGVLA